MAPAELFETNRRWACRIAECMPLVGFDVDDARQHALLGLWDAAVRFDPGNGASFETFAWYRVRGAILDAYREHMPLSRTMRRRGMSVQFVNVFDVPIPLPERDVDRLALERAEQYLVDLPANEAALIRGHYFDGRELQEVSRELGLHKSWATRLQQRAIQRLRRRFKREDAA